MVDRILVKLIGVFILLFLVSPAIADETILGQYCYTYGDRESVQEARELTRTLAIRNAIESYRTYIESTGRVTNFILTNDIVQIISSGYLKDIKVLEHKEKGKTVCDKISATVEPKQIEKVIEKQILLRTKNIEDMGLAKNEYLKILSAEYKGRVTGGYRLIQVRAKALKKFLYPAEQSIIFITVYDDQGNELSTAKNATCFFNQDEPIYPDEIRNCDIKIEGDIYRVWLLDSSQSMSNEAIPTENKQIKKKGSKRKESK